VRSMKSNSVVTDAAHESVADAILAGWQRAGVEVLFTVPGGPLMPFLRACKQRESVRVVICRHETAACIMAASYFHDRRRPAAVALTSGPGAANAFNGIVHALREHAAITIVSARPVSAKVGRGSVQDFDTARQLASVTKRSEQLLAPAQSEFLVSDLLRLACAPAPGPVNLTVCADQWTQPLRGVR
jgi:acetolactate synthase-1/2/3 large subunit